MGPLPGVCGGRAVGRSVGAEGCPALRGVRLSPAVRCLPVLRRRCHIAGKRLSGPGLAAEGRVLHSVLYVYHSRLLRHRSYLALQQVSTAPQGTPRLGTVGPQSSLPKKPLQQHLAPRASCTKKFWSSCAFVLSG